MKIIKATRRDDGYSVIVFWYNIVNPKNVYIIDDQAHVEFVKNEDVVNWEPYHAEVQ